MTAPGTTGIKHRNPFAVWLLLPLVTLGIYQAVWYYKIHKEMARANPAADIHPVKILLALLLLSWTVVGAFVSVYRTGNRIKSTQQALGHEGDCSAALGTVLSCVFGLWPFYYQSQLNHLAP